MTIPISRRLGAHQAARRAGLLAAIAVALGSLRAIDPAGVSWLGPATSCGAMTGLPCIFCGTTRAVHHLLNGQFAQAIYFNWLAYPVVALGVAAALVAASELWARRRLLVLNRWHVTPRSVAIATVAVATLWVVQVSIALCGQKAELLNPAGPLYALFVK